jgi:hypothetical protein
VKQTTLFEMMTGARVLYVGVEGVNTVVEGYGCARGPAREECRRGRPTAVVPHSARVGIQRCGTHTAQYWHGRAGDEEKIAARGRELGWPKKAPSRMFAALPQRRLPSTRLGPMGTGLPGVFGKGPRASSAVASCRSQSGTQTACCRASGLHPTLHRLSLARASSSFQLDNPNTHKAHLFPRSLALFVARILFLASLFSRLLRHCNSLFHRATALLLARLLTRRPQVARYPMH